MSDSRDAIEGTCSFELACAAQRSRAASIILYNIEQTHRRSCATVQTKVGLPRGPAASSSKDEVNDVR